MSVHTEYGRALDALLFGLQRLGAPEARGWAAELVEARVSQNLDLGTAATLCMGVLDHIDEVRSLSSQTGIGPDLDPLREPFDHLRAHCRAVLGLSEETPQAD